MKKTKPKWNKNKIRQTEKTTINIPLRFFLVVAFVLFGGDFLEERDEDDEEDEEDEEEEEEDDNSAVSVGSTSTKKKEEKQTKTWKIIET